MDMDKWLERCNVACFGHASMFRGSETQGEEQKPQRMGLSPRRPRKTCNPPDIVILAQRDLHSISNHKTVR